MTGRSGLCGAFAFAVFGCPPRLASLVRGAQGLPGPGGLFGPQGGGGPGCGRPAGGPECVGGGDGQPGQDQQEEVGDAQDVHEAAGQYQASDASGWWRPGAARESPARSARWAGTRDSGHQTTLAFSSVHATIASGRRPLDLGAGSFTNSHRPSSEGTFHFATPQSSPIYAVDRG